MLHVRLLYCSKFATMSFDDNYQRHIKTIICIFAAALTVSKILIFQMFDLEIYVTANKYKILIEAIQWRISHYIKVIARMFTLVLTVSRILRFEMFYHENLGHDH